MNIQNTATGATPGISPDLSAAQRFLDLLDPAAKTWTFQTFDDNADRKARALGRIFHGTLADHTGSLIDLQQRGAGVFVTINETDGRGREKENIVRVRAAWLDLDGAPIDPVLQWETPQVLVESSPDKWHPYWRLDGLSPDQFKPMQKALIDKFDGDKSVHDLPRVMRLPGFYHQKVDAKKALTGTPCMVRLHDTNAFPAAFAADQFLDKLAKPKLSEHARFKPDLGQYSADGPTVAEVAEALTYISPDLPYHEWLSVLMAIHDQFGGAGVGLADTWSAAGATYQPGEVISKFNGFQLGGGTTIKHVFHLAKQKGADLAALTRKHRGKTRDYDGESSFDHINKMFDGAKREKPKQERDDDAEQAEPVLQGSAAFCAAREPADYLIDGSVRDGWLYTLTAPTGHGKSAVALAMAHAVAKGGVLGSREIKQGAVLFLAGENADDIRERWIATCEKSGDDPASLPVTFMPGVWDLKGCLPMLREQFKSQTLRLVVVDTLAAFFAGDNENDNAQQQEFTTRVLRPLTELPGRPAVIVPAHPTKGAGKDSLTPKGGSSLLNAVDGNMTAWCTDGTIKVHWQGKFRGAPWTPMHFELSEHLSTQLMDSRGRIMPTVTARAMLDSEIAKATERGVKVENQVLKLLNDGLTVREIADDVIADGQRGVSKSRVDRVIQRLAEQKWIAKSGRKWALTSQGLEVLKQAGEAVDTDA